ncbi:unnamed protein product, partial [Laminaria digitata]
MFRSEVKKSGNAKSSVTREPFHCLQVKLGYIRAQHSSSF